MDKYFPQFEKIAANLKWPREFWPTLLQSVLIGKAAEVYSALSLAESSDYDKVKDTILKAYQLVPEAYRQRFRKYKKFENQTYVEFAREKEDLFDQWFRSKKIPDSYDNLRQLILFFFLIIIYFIYLPIYTSKFIPGQDVSITNHKNFNNSQNDLIKSKCMSLLLYRRTLYQKFSFIFKFICIL